MLVLALFAALVPGVRPAAAAGTATTATRLPSHASIVAAVQRAQRYYQPTYRVSADTPPRNGWSWSTWFQGQLAVTRATGDASTLADVLAWGAQHSWAITTSRYEVDPDSLKAAEVYVGAAALDPSADRSAADARMASDLSGLPVSQYDWVDAMFMGLTNWADAYRATGNTAYLDKMDVLFRYERDAAGGSDRCTGADARTGGLWSLTHHLWQRDCRYVGNPDANGVPVFWGRGNGWAIGAMADVLAALPAGSPRAKPYADTLVAMAGALAPLQGSDGMWRTSLLDPALYPVPETSGSALITYGLAYGVRTGLLDGATYRPVVARAWKGLTTVALQSSGFLSRCQDIGREPGTPYTGSAPRTAATSTSAGTLHSDEPPFCAGAFLLAGTEIARLSPDLALGAGVTATSQQAGNEAVHLVDGSFATRWSAQPFPQSATLDLRRTVTLTDAMLATRDDRPYRYRIATSPDRVTWTQRVDRTASTSPGTLLDTFSGGPVSARYVRLTVTGVAGGTTPWVSLQELSLYGPTG